MDLSHLVSGSGFLSSRFFGIRRIVVQDPGLPLVKGANSQMATNIFLAIFVEVTHENKKNTWTWIPSQG